MRHFQLLALNTQLRNRKWSSLKLSVHHLLTKNGDSLKQLTKVLQKTKSTKTITRAEQSIQGDIRIIDEACFRWNTRKAFQVERFLDMFYMSIGLVRPNREFVLCMVG